MPLTGPEFFNLASKIVPNEFDGSEDKLTSFLDALTLLKANVEAHEENAVAYVKTRLTGKARYLVGESATLDEIKTKLKNGIKFESSQSVTSKMLNLKHHNDTKYMADIENLTQKLKQAYISEGVPESVAENYTKNTTVKALSTNTNIEKVKIIMEAGSFQTVEEAIQKFANVTAENSSSASVFYANRRQSRGKSRNYFRGRGNFNQRGGNSSQYRNNGQSNYNNYSAGRYQRNNQNMYEMSTNPNRGFSYRSRPNRYVRTYDADQNPSSQDANQENGREPEQGPLGHS